MGAAKYAERNWEIGMPFSRCVASLKRHVMKYQQGKRDEDHLAAIMFNAMALIHYEEMIERGRAARRVERPAGLRHKSSQGLGRARRPAKAQPKASKAERKAA